jgi:Fe2+ or Zn2+ uptake regulation protein
MSNINPLIAKLKMPGRVFSLPSKGLLYKNNELFPTVTNGEVQVKPLSAMSEIKMRSADMLFSGRAIDEIIHECVSEIKTPFQLFAKDIDAILCYLRIATYGQFFEVETQHTCKGAKQHTLAIDLERVISTLNPLTPEIMSQYAVVLDNEQDVKLTPLRYAALIDLLQMQKNSESITHEEVQELFLKNFVEIVESVDGISDKALIKEWASMITPRDTDKIKQAFENANDAWGLKLTSQVKCPDCGEVFEIDVPVDPVGFFSV